MPPPPSPLQTTFSIGWEPEKRCPPKKAQSKETRGRRVSDKPVLGQGGGAGYVEPYVDLH